MAAVGYLRVSKEDDEQQKIENQRLLIEGHCRLHNIPLEEFYVDDDDVSGVVPFERRPEGKRLLADAHLKKFNTVFIYKLDRIGRDARLILNIVSEFEGLDIRFVSLKDGESIDTASPNGRLMMTILAGFAGFERDSIRQRTRDGAERVAAEGTWMGGIIPYGYRRVGERRSTRIAPAEEPVCALGMSEADAVLWGYRHVGLERGTTITLARHLNEMGVPTRYALGGFKRDPAKGIPCGQWTAATVYTMLTNPLYKGVATYKKQDGSTIQQQVPALVDEELWERVQQRLRDNTKYSRRNGKRDYLLRGLLRCAHCGHAYTGNCGSANGKTYPRYGCYSGSSLHAHRTRCRVRRLSAEAFEAWVWSKVDAFLRDPEALLAEIARRYENTAADLTLLERERGRLSAEISGKDAERRRILSLYRRELISESDVEEQLDTIKKEEMALHRRLHEVESRLEFAQDAEARLEDTRRSLAELSRHYLKHELDREDQRRALETFIDHIDIETLPEKGERGLRPVLCHFHFSFGDVVTFPLSSTSRRQSNVYLTLTYRYAA